MCFLGITPPGSPAGCYYWLMEPHETSPAILRPHDAADEEIKADDAITVDEAILLAKEEHGLIVPKSTLQRWLKRDRVKCVLHVGRYGRKYLIDKEDWLAKSFDISNNDAIRHEASPDPTGSGETSSDTTTPHEAPPETTEKITELEQENLNLKIDKSARDQIITHLKNERGAFNVSRRA